MHGAFILTFNMIGSNQPLHYFADLYASVAPRNSRDKTDSKERNSANLSGGSPNLRPQTSSGSLRVSWLVCGLVS